jgi:Flp pilus assembly protein protease CpaA
MFGQPTLPGTGEILLGILVAIAAYYDIRYRRIPNWLALAGILVPDVCTEPDAVNVCVKGSTVWGPENPALKQVKQRS